MNKLVVFIVGLVLGAVILRVCVPSKTVYIPGDSVFTDVPVYVPGPVQTIYDTTEITLYKYIYNTDTLTLHDTIRIVESYLAKSFYSDTISRDDLTAVINDTVSQNRIISRQFSYMNLRETQVVGCDRFMLGATGYCGSTYGIMLGVGYQDNKRLYMGLFDPLNKIYGAGIYFKF